jgi:hypothetical protein
MGYRSEVAYVIRFRDKEQLDTFIGVQLCKKDEHITQALGELHQIQTTQTEQYLYFYAQEVKWYDDYPDVKAHQKLLEDAVEDYEETASLFIRCGEQADDLEEDGNGDDCWDLYDYISVNRPSICIDVGNTKPILNENNELTESETT